MPLTYHPETDVQEHDSASQTKRVMLFGWNTDTLQPVKLNVDTNGALKTEEWYFMDASVKASSITYIGKEKEDGSWLINKLDETTGVVSRYAGIQNNPTQTTYTAAWTNKATLTYGLRSEAT